MPHTAFLSIGSNIGNAIENCRKALDLIARRKGIKIIKTSSFYRTEPWGDIEGQDWFINCVTEIKTSLNAIQLLRCLQQIENKFEIVRHKKNQPRIIDIDILFFNNRIVKGADLIIPHPFLHKRNFVLVPFLEVEPLFIHPVFNRTIKDLIHKSKDIKRVVKIE